ncbi:MAG: phosphatase PAP2 family protein, partial [Deltaproteobacteria bacterium]|nr:phosphatase PAP2 family protein [Deltaproteobacteria bacterium]
FLPLIFAFLIALSRVFVSAHYPSDVAAGMAIGILGAWFFVSRLHYPDKPQKWPPKHKDSKQNCL